MKLFTIFLLFILFSFNGFRGFLVAYSQAPGESKKIYLRDYSVSDKHANLKQEVQKNTYDVIYDVNIYSLFLTSETNRRSAFIQNYERLTVDLLDDYIEVTLSDKIVVRRRYNKGHPPILDMRLALYELFLGKDNLAKNLEALKKKSLERMKDIQRLIKKQEMIKARKAKKNKPNKVATIPNPTPKAPKPKPKPTIKKPDPKPKPQPKKVKPAVPETPEPEDKFVDDKPKKKKPAPKVVKKPAPKKPKPKPKSKKKPKTDEDNKTPGDDKQIKPPPKPKRALSKKIPPVPTARDSQAEPEVDSSDRVEAPISPPTKHKVYKPGEYETRTSMLVGYTYVTAANDEIIDTNTNLNFIHLGGRMTALLKKKGTGGFWANRDFEARGQISRNTSADGGKYNVSMGRKLEGYAGEPILDGWFGFGGTLSFENVQIGSIKAINQGLTLANINAFFLGPEIKITGELFRRETHFFAGYGYAVFNNSSIKTASYTLDKTYFDFTLYDLNRWGYGVRFEFFDGIGNRGSLGNTRFRVYQTNLHVLYQF